MKVLGLLVCLLVALCVVEGINQNSLMPVPFAPKDKAALLQLRESDDTETVDAVTYDDDSNNFDKEEADIVMLETKREDARKQPVQIVSRSEVMNLRAQWGDLKQPGVLSSSAKPVTRYISHPKKIEMSRRFGGGPVPRTSLLEFISKEQSSQDKYDYDVEFIETEPEAVSTQPPKPQTYSIHYFYANGKSSTNAEHVPAKINGEMPATPQCTPTPCPDHNSYIPPQYYDEPIYIPHNTVRMASQSDAVESRLPVAPVYQDEHDALHASQQEQQSQEVEQEEVVIQKTHVAAEKPAVMLELQTRVLRPATLVNGFLPSPTEMESALLNIPLPSFF